MALRRIVRAGGIGKTRRAFGQRRDIVVPDLAVGQRAEIGLVRGVALDIRSKLQGMGLEQEIEVVASRRQKLLRDIPAIAEIRSNSQRQSVGPVVGQLRNIVGTAVGTCPGASDDAAVRIAPRALEQLARVSGVIVLADVGNRSGNFIGGPRAEDMRIIQAGSIRCSRIVDLSRRIDAAHVRIAARWRVVYLLRNAGRAPVLRVINPVDLVIVIGVYIHARASLEQTRILQIQSAPVVAVHRGTGRQWNLGFQQSRGARVETLGAVDELTAGGANGADGSVGCIRLGADVEVLGERLRRRVACRAVGGDARFIHAQVIRQFGLREVALAHSRLAAWIGALVGGHQRGDQGVQRRTVRIDVTLHIVFAAHVEDHFLVAVELPPRNLHRPPDIESGVDIPVGNLRQLLIFHKPVFGIQLRGAGEPIDCPVIFRAARLAHHRNHRRPLGRVRAKVRCLDLHLGNHVHVHRLRLIALVARIGDVRAIGYDARAIARSAVADIIRQPVAARTHHRGIRADAVVQPVLQNREARLHLQQFAHIPAYSREPLDVRRGDQSAALAGVDDLVFRRHRHRCAHGTYLENDSRQRSRIVRMEFDAALRVGPEAAVLDPQRINSRGNRAELVNAFPVGLRFTGVL